MNKPPFTRLLNERATEPQGTTEICESCHKTLDCGHRLSAKNTSATSTTMGESIVVEKSASDDRLYRYLLLPNELRVLLVSDPTSEKATKTAGNLIISEKVGVIAV